MQALELRLKHRARPATRVRVGLASITGERRRLTDVVSQKLSRLELAAPVRGMELLSGTLRPLSAGSLDVFASLGSRRRRRYGAAIGGAFARAARRGSGLWHVLDSGTSARGGVAAGPCTTRCELRRCRRATPMAHREIPEQGMPRPVWLLDSRSCSRHAQVRQLQAGVI